jgi:enoyl-CoA hydratase/carnithine racemase
MESLHQETHVAIVCSGNRDRADGSATILKLAQSILDRKSLTVFICGSVCSELLFTLGLACDLLYVTDNTNVALSCVDHPLLPLTAALMATRLGRPRATGLFLKDNLDAADLLDSGLAGGIIGQEDFEQPISFIARTLSGVSIAGIVSLKNAVARQAGLSRQDALALERTAFAECFEKGAAQSIAAYLQKSVKSK